MLTHSNSTRMTSRTGLIARMFAVAVILFTLQPVSAHAQDMKIGFVEPRIILERMPEMAAVQQRLQNFADRKRTELLQQETSLQQQLQSYQERASVMSADARANEEERLGQLSNELQQSQALAEQELAERRASLMSPLLQQVQEAIDAVAAAKGIDIVLNTTTSTGDVIILYVAESLRAEVDITDDVMARLEI